ALPGRVVGRARRPARRLAGGEPAPPFGSRAVTGLAAKSDRGEARRCALQRTTNDAPNNVEPNVGLWLGVGAPASVLHTAGATDTLAAASPRPGLMRDPRLEYRGDRRPPQTPSQIWPTPTRSPRRSLL